MTDIQKAWVVLALIIFSLLVYLLQPILMPFLIGALLAYLGDPLADRLEARGLGRTQAVCIVFFGLTFILFVVVLLTFPMIGHQLDVLAKKIPLWIESAQFQWLPWIQEKLGLPKNSLPVGELKSVVSENWKGAGQILTKIWVQGKSVV